MMEEIYGAMVIAFGVPPKPNEVFEWTYVDKDDKYHRTQITPRELYKSCDFKAEDHFSLINDPRNEYNTLYTVDRLKNGISLNRLVLTIVSEGRGIAYVNTTINTMKSWQASRNAYVLSQMQTNFGVTTSFPIVNGYMQTTSGTITSHR